MPLIGDGYWLAVEIVRRLGVFWGSIEVDASPDWGDKEVDYNGIKSGSYILMEYLAAIAGLSPDLEKQSGPSVQ